MPSVLDPGRAKRLDIFMSAKLKPQPKDPLLQLIDLFEADARETKTDLGVGVYRDETGRTPVMRAVKTAERILWDHQESKAYLGIAGDREFLDRLWRLVRGPRAIGRPVAALQSVGGSAALRIAAELFARAGCRRVWVGTPTWPNHYGILRAARIDIATFDAFDVTTQTIAFDGVVAALERADPGDAVLLHACCNNPSGAAYSASQWTVIAERLREGSLLPLIDIAYQGFGSGLDADLQGVRLILDSLPEAYLAVSCSKTFGLYRERVGALYAVTTSPAAAAVVESNLLAISRVAYSMPPAHGAAIVRTILADDELTRSWMDELSDMRGRIASVRKAIAPLLAARWPALAAIAHQEGMFSLLPLDDAQIMEARRAHGIYMPASGRINLAGLRSTDVATMAARLVTL